MISLPLAARSSLIPLTPSLNLPSELPDKPNRLRKKSRLYRVPVPMRGARYRRPRSMRKLHMLRMWPGKGSLRQVTKL